MCFVDIHSEEINPAMFSSKKTKVFLPFTHFLVYTASNFSEQSFPSVLLVVDTSASASHD